jgi:hypothetical protein
MSATEPADPAARKRRPRPAASARALTAGVSTAATFGIMTALAATAGTGTDQPVTVPEAEAPGPETVVPRTIVVIRRHLVQVPAGGATPAVTPSEEPGFTPAPRPRVVRRPEPDARTRSS